MEIKDSPTLGQAVRDARKRRGLRQEDVALASGVGLRFLHDLEHGKPTIELERLLRVVHAVGLELWLDERPRP